MRRILLTILIALIAYAPVQAANTIMLTDENGTPIGNLPALQRGDELLVPSALLTRKANWGRERDGKSELITAPGDVVVIKRGNPFVKVNDSHVQLPLAPEEWDGSLWLPVSALGSVFPHCLVRDEATGALRITVAPEEEPEAAPAEERKSELQSAPEGWRLGTVIIDPGHGGKDPGATGLYDLVEKDLTLDIAKRIERELRANNIRVMLTRDGDTFLPLKDRTKLANSQQGDLFVSIHANSFRDPTIGGFECYFLSPARTDRAIAVATKENAVVDMESQEHAYQDLTEENYILMTMATAQYMKDSETWAGITIEEAAEHAGLDVRGIDQAGFYVLMGASMPAVLVECGFLTNREDAKQLASERGRQRIAESVANSIVRMKQSMEATASR